jgi:hypothetical protein
MVVVAAAAFNQISQSSQKITVHLVLKINQIKIS